MTVATVRIIDEEPVVAKRYNWGKYVYYVVGKRSRDVFCGPYDTESQANGAMKPLFDKWRAQSASKA